MSPNYRNRFLFGIILVGVGITFTTTLNKPVGIAMLVIGGLLMLDSARNKEKWIK